MSTMARRSVLPGQLALWPPPSEERDYDVCHRSLKIYATPSYDELGSTPVGATQWKWNRANCEKNNIKVIFGDGENAGREDDMAE